MDENPLNLNINFGNNNTVDDNSRPPQQDNLIPASPKRNYSDLEPIIMDSSTVRRNYNNYRNTNSVNTMSIHFQPNILIFIGSIMLIIAMFVTWATVDYSFGVGDYTLKITQYELNQTSCFILFAVVALTFYGAIKDKIGLLCSSAVFFVADAIYVISKLQKSSDLYKITDGMFNIKFSIGFYIYIIGCVIIVFAILIKYLSSRH